MDLNKYKSLAARSLRIALIFVFAMSSAFLGPTNVSSVLAQSLGTAGTIEGVVADPSGALIPSAAVSIENRVTGYKRTTSSDANGAFRFENIPPNSYLLSVAAPGFNPGGAIEGMKFSSILIIQVHGTNHKVGNGLLSKAVLRIGCTNGRNVAHQFRYSSKSIILFN